MNTLPSYSLMITLAIVASLSSMKINATSISLTENRDVPSLNGYYSYDIQIADNGVAGGLYASGEINLMQPHYVKSRSAVAAMNVLGSAPADTGGWTNLYASSVVRAAFYVSVNKKANAAPELSSEVPIVVDWLTYVSPIGDHTNGFDRSSFKARASTQVYFSSGSDNYNYQIAKPSTTSTGGAITETTQMSGKERLTLGPDGMYISLYTYTGAQFVKNTWLNSPTPLGWLGVEAFSDPIISIDPEWEFADFYELNIEANNYESVETEFLTGDLPSLSTSQVSAPSMTMFLLISLFTLSLNGAKTFVTDSGFCRYLKTHYLRRYIAGSPLSGVLFLIKSLKS